MKKSKLQKDILFYKKQYEDECKAPKQPIKKKEDIKGSKLNNKEEYLHPDQINDQGNWIFILIILDEIKSWNYPLFINFCTNG